MRIEVHEEEPIRIDNYISKEVEWTSRSAVQKWIKNGAVALNGKVVLKSNVKVKEGDLIEISVPKEEEIKLEPENIPLDIVYEDEYLVVINKPAGMVVHPGAGVTSGTLVNALLYHFQKLSSLDATRPGIVHRLDKDTSGLMIVAKDDIAHRKLSDMLKERTIKKSYLAILIGKFQKESGTIIAPIGRNVYDRKKMGIRDDGRYAETGYKVLEIYRGFSLVEFYLKTGRTHQIRVHSKFVGHPIAGDITYGGKISNKDFFFVKRQMLHSNELKFYHPITGEFLEFVSELPEDFLKMLTILREKYS